MSDVEELEAEILAVARREITRLGKLDKLTPADANVLLKCGRTLKEVRAAAKPPATSPEPSRGGQGFLERLAASEAAQPDPDSRSPVAAETPTTPIQPSTDPTVHPWCRGCQAGRCDTHLAPAASKVISAHAAPPEAPPALTNDQRAQVEQILRPTMPGADPETDPLGRKWREANGIPSHAPEPPAAPPTPAPRPATPQSRAIEHSSLTRAFPGHEPAPMQSPPRHYYG